MQKINNIIIGFVIAGFIVINSFFTVEQTKTALVFQFGEVVRIIKEPGLAIKIPFIQKVTFFDNRVLNLTSEKKEIQAIDQKRMIISAFTKYRISDVLKAYKSVTNEYGAMNRLNSIIESSIRQVVGGELSAVLLSNQRSSIMNKIQETASKSAHELGIELVDVRILRADLPEQNSQAIYKRMQTNYEKDAKQFRAEGMEKAQEIRSTADKKARLIRADAQKKSEILKGKGDAQAMEIYSSAFSKDSEFYEFFRAMQAYRITLGKDNTKMVISPDSDFFKHLKSY